MEAAQLPLTPITVANVRQRANLRVALVNMPFHSTRYPSIALGLLHAGLVERGYRVHTANIALQFAARLGWEEYETIASDRWRFAGEWLFARAAFGESAPDGERWLGDRAGAEVLCGALGRDTNWLLGVREQLAPSFIDECLGLLPWGEYDVVGFGSMFQQNCAALALARRLKERYPALVTVFGGANLEGEMGLELVRAMPMVDYAVIGEGDEVLPALLQRLEAGEQEVYLPGVARRNGSGEVVYSNAVQQVRDLDALPDPNYDDYFAAVETTAMPGVVRNEAVHLPYESTRGCWWGLKHHCTFCGIANLDTSYRRKSPVRVLNGIDGLARRYGLYNLLCVDSIMDMRYVSEVFEPLAAQRKDYHFFAEVKANLTREQLRTLRRAGVTSLQPGIESVSTRLLQLMRKGVSGIQNVRLLKWCEYYGIHPAWNILTGFPGETADDYARQLDVLRLIPHLQPPGSCGPIKLNRFSPYFDAPQAWSISDVRPDPAYAHIYPAHVNLDRLAYEFDHSTPAALPIEVHRELAAYVGWSASRARATELGRFPTPRIERTGGRRGVARSGGCLPRGVESSVRCSGQLGIVGPGVLDQALAEVVASRLTCRRNLGTLQRVGCAPAGDESTASVLSTGDQLLPDDCRLSDCTSRAQALGRAYARPIRQILRVEHTVTTSLRRSGWCSEMATLLWSILVSWIWL